MNYEDCKKIVEATKHIFEGTQYAIDYYLDAEPYFTLNGEIIDADEVPEEIKTAFTAIVETLEIEY